MKWLRYCIAALLLCAAPTHANFSMIAYNGGSVPFQGDPGIAASTIVPVATCSRISGTTPFFLQCSAYNSSGTGIAIPYEEVQYKWDFGNPSADTFTRPTDGSAQSANVKYGPEASGLYRSAGSYTITLTATACTSGNCSSVASTISASTTQSVTVTAFNPSGGDFFYSAAGSGTTCSSGAPCALSQFPSKLANQTGHHLNKGDTFTGTAFLDVTANVSVSGVRVDSNFGSGANAIINTSSGANPCINVTYSAGAIAKSDFVFSGLTCTDSGSATLPNNILVTAKSTGGSIQDIYFDNLTVNNTLDLSGFNNVEFQRDTSGDQLQRVGFWNCTVSGPLNATLVRDGLLGGPFHWMFIVGGTVTGAGADSILDHHYYVHIQDHLEARWITFGSSGPSATRNLGLKVSYDIGLDGSAFNPQYVLISENYFSGTLSAHDASNGTLDPTLSRWLNFVSQQNAMTGLAPGTNGMIVPDVAETITIRDNRVWNSTGVWLNGASQLQNTPTFMKARVYRNFIYTGDCGSLGGQLQFTGKTFTTAQVIMDNWFWGTCATARLADIVFTDAVASGWTIIRNKWNAPSAPNGGLNFNEDNGGRVPFSPAGSAGTWQHSGFDTGGAIQVPTWTVPPTSWNSFNFLLKRDLDPANDNTPMWLNAVA